MLALSNRRLFEPQRMGGVQYLGRAPARGEGGKKAEQSVCCCCVEICCWAVVMKNNQTPQHVTRHTSRSPCRHPYRAGGRHTKGGKSRGGGLIINRTRAQAAARRPSTHTHPPPNSSACGRAGEVRWQERGGGGADGRHETQKRHAKEEAVVETGGDGEPGWADQKQQTAF